MKTPLKPKATDATQKMQTLSECITSAQQQGYKENFKMSALGLTSGDGDSVYSPSNVSIRNFYRFEGYSDPGDNAILYLIQTSDWKKGILIDAYGSDADARLSSFIKNVAEIQKKPSLRSSSWMEKLMGVFRKPRHSNA